MKQVIYVCDNCKRKIGKKTHISMAIGHSAGYYEEQADKSWRKIIPIQQGIYQFCDHECLGLY